MPRSFGSPYVSGSYGYDASYPQCPNPGPPAGATFTVLGVNGGKAFTSNPCLFQEWQLGIRPRGLYLNTGYNPDNAGRITAACQAAAARSGLAGDYLTAYAIGCSEADYSLQQVGASFGSWQPIMWWLDVETDNSWSTTDLALNRAALTGILNKLTPTGLAVGVYSTGSMWQAITGGWSHPAIAADWVALSDRSACGRGFSGAPVWLVQPWPSGSTDSDWAC